MIERSRYASDHCGMARTLGVIGERWTLLVLREAFYGVGRFEEMQRTLGVARNVLTARLQTLVDHELLERRPYKLPGSRERHEYRLTPQGRDLYPVLVALMEWGDHYLGDPEGPPVLLEHRDCGARLRVRVVCEEGHDDLTARDSAPVAGPAMASHRTGAGVPPPGGTPH